MQVSFQEKQESTSFQTYQHWAHSLDPEQISQFGKTLKDTSSISKEILYSVKNEKLTMEILDYLAAELLAVIKR